MKAARLYDYDPQMNVQLKLEAVSYTHLTLPTSSTQPAFSWPMM